MQATPDAASWRAAGGGRLGDAQHAGKRPHASHPAWPAGLPAGGRQRRRSAAAGTAHRWRFAGPGTRPYPAFIAGTPQALPAWLSRRRGVGIRGRLIAASPQRDDRADIHPTAVPDLSLAGAAVLAAKARRRVPGGGCCLSLASVTVDRQGTLLLDAAWVVDIVSLPEIEVQSRAAGPWPSTRVPLGPQVDLAGAVVTDGTVRVMSQAARSACSGAGAGCVCLSAGASAAGRGRRAPAGGKRACDTSTSVSLT